MNNNTMKHGLEFERFKDGVLIARQCEGVNCVDDQVVIYDHERVQVMRAICPHDRLVEVDYLRPCRDAGCNFQTGEHANCGQQFRIECERCGAVLYDSGDYDPQNPQRDADYGALVAKYYGESRRE